MPEEYTDYDAFAARLRQLIREHSPKIIGIEGVMQAGKTHLAGRLAQDLGAVLVEIDKCSYKNRDPERFQSLPDELPYSKLIDLDALNRELSAALASAALVIVEGICLRDMLRATNRTVDITVYVKSLSANTGMWHTEYDIEDYEGGSEVYEGFYKDEIDYHSRMRPHELAELVFVRVEESHRGE